MEFYRNDGIFFQKCIMKRNILFAIICLAVAMFFSVAFFSPVKYVQRYVPVGECIKVLTKDDISQMNGCEVNSSGQFIVTGEDPNIVFENINLDVKGIMFNVEDSFKDKISGQVFVDVGQGFSEGLSSRAATVAGQSFLCFSISGNQVQSVRLDINRYSEFVFESIELYNQPPKLEWMKIYPDFWRVLLAIGSAILVGVSAYLYDWHTNVSLKIQNVIQSRYLKSIFFIGGIVAMCLSGAGMEYVIGHIGAFERVASTGFNHYRCMFICHVLVTIYSFYCFRKSLSKKPENMFLILVLVTGSMMITVAPFGGNSWDEAIHYRWADNASYYKEADVSMANYMFDMLDEYVDVKENPQENAEAIEAMNRYDLNLVDYRDIDTTVAHRVSGLFIAAARMVGCSFYESYLLGKYAVLLVYALICFWAMRKLKSGKMILAVIAMFPTSVFLATSYSYDYWVTCFSMLGMSYFISELQKPYQPVSMKDTLIMTGAFAVASLPKIVYATLLIIPFFMIKKNLKKTEYKKYYGICSIVIVMFSAVLLFVAFQQIAGPGDLRGGTEVKPSNQVAYIFQNPMMYITDLIRFMASYLSPRNVSRYMVYMAYFGIGAGATIILGLLIFVTFTDKTEVDAYSSTWLNRVAVGIVFLGSVALVATSLYVAFTPVGSRVFKGCQYRYLIPLLFPLLSVMGSSKFSVKIKRSWYNGIVMGIMTVLCYYNVYTLILPRLV